jgi:hypothetical protein
MRLICERTTFIPGFCVFTLHRNRFGASQPPTPSTTYRSRVVTRKCSVARHPLETQRTTVQLRRSAAFT